MNNIHFLPTSLFTCLSLCTAKSQGGYAHDHQQATRRLGNRVWIYDSCHQGRTIKRYCRMPHRNVTILHPKRNPAIIDISHSILISRPIQEHLVEFHRKVYFRRICGSNLPGARGTVETRIIKRISQILKQLTINEHAKFSLHPNSDKFRIRIRRIQRNRTR